MAGDGQGPYEVDIEEVEYLRHGDKRFLARVFRPRGQGPFPAVIDAHGGAWCRGDRTNNDPINEAVARGGVVVAALDFRNPPDAIYPGSVADVNYGVRWLKSEAARFDSAPGMVGAMGTSSGGHLVVLAALKPDDPRYASIPLPSGAAVDARVPYVVTLWPVICPVSRYREFKARLADDPGNTHLSTIVGNQDTYWLTEEAMIEGSPNLAVQRGDAIDTPNMLYLQNATDHTHPRANLDTFVAGYRKAGGDLTLEFFDGENYDQVRSAPESPSARGAVRKIVEFIHREAAAVRAPVG
jgi:acetyl esterase/lipase